MTQRLLALLAASVLALAACSAGDDTATAGPVRTVTDIDGEPVEVPEKPERVVALSEPTLDALVTLGVTPVGAVTGRGQGTVPAYLADELADVPVLGGIAQPNYEAIGKADPDLILVDGTSINNNADALEALRRIAPTVYTGYAGGDWRTNFEITADALGQADEGADVIAAYDTRVADLKSRLAQDHADATFSIVRWQGGAPSLILKELPAGRALSDLGLRRPPAQDREGRGHSEPVSLENLDQIDADYLFFGTLGGASVDNPEAGGSADAAGSRAALAEAAATPGFDRLEAQREDHVIAVDGSAWTSTGGPRLMNRIVDDVESELLP
ncbi:ABC transporter substrate-binding protein [Aeromicrobium sp. Marseille-Q0843]|uniref:ABC transporter substrate-binding protein n=1 Tax=Aeromicrobium phoceense TaxID=2754045 RepID=A0A838XGX9_9ACTN|nr:ABC transporter substrate-binding protein [Aeromicrobium phoceense]MBA4609835.1 ABC transporter substrate-binding protein [Aeromicrobium phoceense]